MKRKSVNSEKFIKHTMNERILNEKGGEAMTGIK